MSKPTVAPARVSIAHLQEKLAALEAAVATLRTELDFARAEVDVLRGVGCEADGDGPCGACLKCAKRELDQYRNAWERTVGVLENTTAKVATLRQALQLIASIPRVFAGVGGSPLLGNEMNASVEQAREIAQEALAAVPAPAAPPREL